jgi:hypothetical protein
VILSGNGSSDSDGREGPSNDVPAHVSGIAHYYWDFQPSVDTGGAKPPYVDNVEYHDCDGEDCDRDDDDETNDDKDAQGKTVEFTCQAEGEYPIHFMVWDEHHNEKRERVENIAVNKGRHWLHFNVDESDVLVRCIVEKKSVPEHAPQGSSFQYIITLVGNPALDGPAHGAMTDALPEWVVIDGEVTCTAGACGYSDATHTVIWGGELAANQIVEVRIPVRVPPEAPPGEPPIPPEIVNCALVFDGVESRQACATTTIDVPLATFEKTASVESVAPGGVLHYTLTVSSVTGGPHDVAAQVLDQLAPALRLHSEVLCSLGACGYDEETHTVFWMGLVGAGEVVTIEFDALFLPEDDPPPAVENCAAYSDVNGASDEACVSTPVVVTVVTGPRVV